MNNTITTITSWLAGGLLFTTFAAQAQTRFSIGPRLGLNVSTAPYKSNVPYGLLRTYSTGYLAGLEAGVAGNLGLGHVAVQPAVLYSQKGFTIHDADLGSFSSEQRDDTYRLHYLTIPLSFAFTQHTDGQGVQVAVGGYLGFLLGGKFQGTTTYGGGYYNYGSTPTATRTVSYAGDVSTTQLSSTTFYSRGTDAGLQGSIGYRYGGALLQVGYSLGLRELGYQSLTFNTSYYNRAFQASLTYLFGPKD